MQHGEQRPAHPQPQQLAVQSDDLPGKHAVLEPYRLTNGNDASNANRHPQLLRNEIGFAQCEPFCDQDTKPNADGLEHATYSKHRHAFVIGNAWGVHRFSTSNEFAYCRVLDAKRNVPADSHPDDRIADLCDRRSHCVAICGAHPLDDAADYGHEDAHQRHCGPLRHSRVLHRESLRLHRRHGHRVARCCDPATTQ
jgi:hypothetical protein